MRRTVNMLKKLTTLQASRYIELTKKLLDDLNGIKLDLSDPCDRAILNVCGLTDEETFELLSLFDALNAPDLDELDDTKRVSISTQDLEAIR